MSHQFAKRGYQGTSTEDVARAAGISQPYLFKMFPTTAGKIPLTVARVPADPGIIEATRKEQQR